MGRGNWRPSRDWPASDFLHFDIPMLAYEAHLKEYGEDGWKTHQGELTETTRDYFNHFMEQIKAVLPPSFYEDDRPRQGEHVLYSNSLCHIIFAEEDTYYAVAVVARDDLHEYRNYDDPNIEPLAVAYVERHGKRILDKLARLYPRSTSYPTSAWTSAQYTPPEEKKRGRKNHQRRHEGQGGRAQAGA
jgi:hypothetical protein